MDYAALQGASAWAHRRLMKYADHAASAARAELRAICEGYADQAHPSLIRGAVKYEPRLEKIASGLEAWISSRG